MKTVCFIDAKNFIWRVHFTHRNLSYNGFPTGVIYGGLYGLTTLRRAMPEAEFVFCWDGEGKTWRHEYDPKEYKANRVPNPDGATVAKQLPIFKETLRCLGVTQTEIPNLEADDLIGILAAHVLKTLVFDNAIIYSTDRDYYQLVRDRLMLVQKVLQKGKLQTVSAADVKRQFRVDPKLVPAVRAFTGDKSDNIPIAVRGLGPRRAAALINSEWRWDFNSKRVPDMQAIPEKYRDVLAESWPRVCKNFFLSRIIEAVGPPLPRSVCDALQVVIRNRFNLVNRRWRYTEAEESSRWVKITALIQKYDMMELMPRRKDLVNIAEIQA